MLRRFGVLAVAYPLCVGASLLAHYPWRLSLLFSVPLTLALAVFLLAELQGWEYLSYVPLFLGLSQHDVEGAALVVGAVNLIIALMVVFINRERAGAFCRFGLCSLAIPLVIYIAGG